MLPNEPRKCEHPAASVPIIKPAKGYLLLIGEVRDDANIGGNFGFWTWSTAYYNHANNMSGNCVFTDGHTQTVRSPFATAVLSGDVPTQ